ncbi:MAG: UbiA family prenyltransferase [Pirellulales bacterium]|nr:UbiA family prenyltransferase [Pirellulales bacterium]
MNDTTASNPSKLFTLAELVRLPNVFTAVADVSMGCLFVLGAFNTWGSDTFITYAMLVATSCLMYCGGMVLNDVFDYEVDLKERPERPLPSGRLTVNFAQFFGFELLLLGTALAWTISFFGGSVLTGIVASLLAVAVILYDAVLKSTLLGPFAMGACRFLNVLMGMSLVEGGQFDGVHYLVAGGIGVYIVGLTIFARQEAEESNRVVLVVGSVVMLLGISALAALAEIAPDLLIDQLRNRTMSWYTFWLVVSMLTVWRCARAIARPEPIWVQMAVKNGILSLIILDAAVIYGVAGLSSAVAVLALLVPTIFLGKWLYST